MLHLPLIYWKMPPLRVTKWVCEAIHTHTNPWGRLKWQYNHHADKPLYVGPDRSTWSYLPYWDSADVVKHHKTSNPQPYENKQALWSVLIKWTQLNGCVVKKNNLILIMEICSEYWSTSRNLDTKITHNIVKTTHTVLVQVQIHNEYNIYIP